MCGYHKSKVNMRNFMASIAQTNTWIELKSQQKLMQQQNIRDLFALDPQRFDKFSYEIR